MVKAIDVDSSHIFLLRALLTMAEHVIESDRYLFTFNIKNLMKILNQRMLININHKKVIFSFFWNIGHHVKYTEKLEKLWVFKMVTIFNEFQDFLSINVDHHSLDLRLIGKGLI